MVTLMDHCTSSPSAAVSGANIQTVRMARSTSASALRERCAHSPARTLRTEWRERLALDASADRDGSRSGGGVLVIASSSSSPAQSDAGKRAGCAAPEGSACVDTCRVDDEADEAGAVERRPAATALVLLVEGAVRTRRERADCATAAEADADERADGGSTAVTLEAGRGAAPTAAAAEAVLSARSAGEGSVAAAAAGVAADHAARETMLRCP